MTEWQTLVTLTPWMISELSELNCLSLSSCSIIQIISVHEINPKRHACMPRMHTHTHTSWYTEQYTNNKVWGNTKSKVFFLSLSYHTYHLIFVPSLCQSVFSHTQWHHCISTINMQNIQNTKHSLKGSFPAFFLPAECWFPTFLFQARLAFTKCKIWIFNALWRQPNKYA